TRIARCDLAEEVGRLKREPGNDLIAHGGARFDQSLSRLGLVDEDRLMIPPAAVGAGLPLFRGPAPSPASRAPRGGPYPSGFAIHVYRPRSVRTDQPEQV